MCQAVLDSGIDEQHPLYTLTSSLSAHLLNSRSDNTVKTYCYGFLKWEKIIIKHSFVSLPAMPIHVALYLTLVLLTIVCQQQFTLYNGLMKCVENWTLQTNHLLKV